MYLLVSLFIVVYYKFFAFILSFNINKVETNRNKTKTIIKIKHNSFEKVKSSHKSKFNRTIWLNTILFSIVVIVFAVTVYVAFVGYNVAKNKIDFLIVADINNHNEKFVKIYSDNDKIVCYPYTIAGSSIIIDNRLIIVKSNVNISLSKIENLTAELVLNSDGTINENSLDKLSNVKR